MKSKSSWPAAWGTAFGCLAIMVAIYVTKEPICLWGLILVVILGWLLTPDSYYPPENYHTRCPKCDCRFLADQLDEDDDEKLEK